jgi:hypothetical protein
MSTNTLTKNWVVFSLVIFVSFSASLSAQELTPGKVAEIEFSEESLPKTLYSIVSGQDVAPSMTICLPDDYKPDKSYPLLVYLRGRDGGINGNIDIAQEIAGDNGWIVASLPLFKKSIDKDEIYGGIVVSFDDYPVISKAYSTMLGKLFELVPNVDHDKSAFVGFSNGAYTIAILVSCQDEFVLKNFKNFGLIDSGYWYLNGLHKNALNNSRFLLLVGDQRSPERDIIIRQAQMIMDASKWVKAEVKLHFMKDTGHQFPFKYKQLVGKWLRNEALASENNKND